MGSSSTHPNPNIDLDTLPHEFAVVLATYDEWLDIMYGDNDARSAALDQVEARRDARRAVETSSYPTRPQLVTLELAVHEDATDGELLAAARQALAAGTEAVTS